MRKHGLALIATALLASAGLPALAQQSEAEVGKPPAPPAGWTAPKTPWGDLDLRGTYPLIQGRTPMQRPDRFGERALYTDEEYAEAVEQADFVEAGADREDAANQLGGGNWFEWGTTLRQNSLIVEPADGRIKMNEEGRRRAATMKSSWSEQVFETRDDFNSLDHCITRGLPASMIPFPYNNGLRIFQTPGHVAINLEMIHETRIIPLGDAEPLPDALRPWLGSSRGRFEGNKLIVETTNFNGGAPMVIVGPSNQPIPTSKSMKVVEHFTLYGPEQVYYEAWIEDPEVLEQPFKLGFPWRRDDSYQFFEYACHEGNTLVRAYITATSPRFEEWRKANGGN
jgi:hypothetical protein